MNGVRASAGAVRLARSGPRRLRRPRHPRRRARRPSPSRRSRLTQALATSPFLYDYGKDRALKKDADGNLIDFSVHDVIAARAAPDLVLGEGLAIPVRSDGGEGELFLEGVASLSTDHIDLGEQIAADIAVHLQRHAMLAAAEDSAEARRRLTLARDLHDSVVQFLAGAAFRLEAIKRSQASGRDFEPQLDELKQLMLQEQRELRSIITALRSGPLVAFDDLVKDLSGLAGRLSRQWDIECTVTARKAELMIPIRLHLDAHQLMREAVANAVRHAEANSVTVELAATADELRLVFVNDVTVSPAPGKRLEMPASLQERVEQSGGTLDMSRGMGVTKVSITLPIAARRRDPAAADDPDFPRRRSSDDPYRARGAAARHRVRNRRHRGHRRGDPARGRAARPRHPAARPPDARRQRDGSAAAYPGGKTLAAAKTGCELSC